MRSDSWTIHLQFFLGFKVIINFKDNILFGLMKTLTEEHPTQLLIFQDSSVDLLQNVALNKCYFHVLGFLWEIFTLDEITFWCQLDGDSVL